MARDGPFVGHTHFWERAMSRRQFVATSAVATGAALTSGFWLPMLVDAAGIDPNPIPVGGIGGDFRVFLPGPGNEPSTITDFDGSVGVADLSGTGTAKGHGPTRTLPFDADVRFMKGRYVGKDGQQHSGTFCFV